MTILTVQILTAQILYSKKDSGISGQQEPENTRQFDEKNQK